MQIRNITGPNHVYPCGNEHSLGQVAGIDTLDSRDRGLRFTPESRHLPGEGFPLPEG